MRRVLVLRPQPAASETVVRAAARGLVGAAAPLFTVRPVAWSPPHRIGAVMLTSANAARHGGEALCSLLHLPVFVVGTATAAAARAAGFADVRSADGDGDAVLALVETARPERVLHLVGRDHLPLDSVKVAIERCVVYAADPTGALPDEARASVALGAVVLLHSPRAAARFGMLIDAAGVARASVTLAAISVAAAAAAGSGWRAVAVAVTPDDDALLAAAEHLCDN